MGELEKLKFEWMKNPEFAKEYNGLETEFELANALIRSSSEFKSNEFEAI
jgi:hypothetical protein